MESVLNAAPELVPRKQKSYLLLCGSVALYAVVLLVYSQTQSFAWDEGYHMVAAQMISRGKQPYLDFIFPQTPLNAYWNAAWMSIFGLSWRLAHALAALLTSGAVMLTADFVFTRLDDSRWRLGCAISAAMLAGFNPALFEFGPIGQAYGMCLFLSVGAFRLAIRAAERDRILWAAGAGLLATAAAESSLLTAAVAPVLLIWLLVCSRSGSRWLKFGAFASGVVVALTPLIWLFARAPRLVFFNLVEYQLIYRTVNWPGATQHNLEAWIAWIDNPGVLLLGCFAIGGLIAVRKHPDWHPQRRRELYLCGWLALGLIVHISTAHPTFTRYYLLAVPELSILAAVGVYMAGSRVVPDRPWQPALLLTVILTLNTAKFIYDDKDSFHWRNLEAVARKVEQVTPPAASLLADEHIYFILKRTPPSGEELEDSHKLGLLPPGLAEKLHVVPTAELDRQIKAGAFDTLEVCDDDPSTNRAIMFEELYKQNTALETCHITWQKK